MTLPTSGPLSLANIQTEFGGSNPIGMNEYYAGGGLVPSGTTGTYGAVPSSGALSVQNFYGTSNFVPVYVEDVFSTWLYTGNGASQTITNGINLSGSGGLVWGKNRTFADNHYWCDSARGTDYGLYSNNAFAQAAGGGTTFNSTGFTVSSSNGYLNANGYPFVSWTFRKQPKFFDVVTYTGNGGYQVINHNLGSVPGCIIIKRTDAAGDWGVWHRSAGASGGDGALLLNTTAARYGAGIAFSVSSTTFSVFNSDFPMLNSINGATYVAYLFAHDAGGFGLTGTDNVISCGSYTADGTNQTISLGYEPQWVMVKRATNIGDWWLLDNMRGWSLSTENALKPNSSAAEDTGNTEGNPTATGFFIQGAGNLGVKYAGVNQTMIYIAIRRGPMKVPTSGTSVFAAQNNRNGPGSATAPSFVSNFPIDMFMRGYKPGSSASFQWLDDRLRDAYLVTSATNAEAATGGWKFDCQTGVYFQSLASSTSEVGWMFRRAPGFFDEVCYTGVFTAQTINHNLTVAPEMIITKKRSSTSAWPVYHIGVPSPQVNQPNLNATGGYYANNWYPGAPTSTTFTAQYQDNGSTYVAYLFATCAGVSKVGSYTGTAALQTVNCGFTSGARFVLIKRIDTDGDWYVWDSARGITSGNDPYLLLNSTAAETTGTNYVDTTSVGFQVTAAAPAGLNASGGTYIFLAIA